MARKKTAAPKHVEPEDESQEELEEEPEADEADEEPQGGGDKSMTKTEAIRRALAAGFEGPQEGTAYIRKEFGIEIAPQHFSATKSQLKSREGKAKSKGRPGRKPRQVAETGHVAAPAKPAAGGDSEMIDDLAAVKHLVQRLGADQVRKIVGLFE